MLSLGSVVFAILAVLNLNPVALYPQVSGREPKTPVADELTVDWANQTTPATQVFVRPSPAEYIKAVDENKDVLRARIVLDGATTVEFYERPKDINFYDSTIVVDRRGVTSRSFNVGNLMKHQALSLVHVGIVPLGSGAGLLVCEYEGGAVGAREGFAILRFSSGSFDLHTLPLTDFGKVVINRGKPEQVEIWSALPYPAGSDADPRAYTTQACRWETSGYACDPPKRKRERFSPATIDDPRNRNPSLNDQQMSQSGSSASAELSLGKLGLKDIASGNF